MLCRLHGQHASGRGYAMARLSRFADLYRQLAFPDLRRRQETTRPTSCVMRTLSQESELRALMKGLLISLLSRRSLHGQRDCGRLFEHSGNRSNGHGRGSRLQPAQKATAASGD